MLLAATAAIRLDLYLTGYRSIPAIGWLFPLRVITAFTKGRRRAHLQQRADRG